MADPRALIQGIKLTDGQVQLFVGTDPIRYDVDNRPLRNLISNDNILMNELQALKNEVWDARDDSSTGSLIQYDTLDARLEAMGISNAGNASVSYAIFQAQAERNRAIYQSGWLTMPTTKSVAPGYDVSYNGYSGDDFGGLFGTEWLNRTYADTMYLNASYDGQYVPVSLLVNGWLIKLVNMQAGGAAAFGLHNAIKLPPAPTSGGREDFVFLEVWLKEIPAASPIFWKFGTPQYAAATYGEGVPVENGNYTTNPLDPSVVHSLTRLSNGNWLQVQHRFRVVANIDPATGSADGFSGTNAAVSVAQGAQSAPVAGKSFTNMLGELADAGLYRAGDGASDTSTLGTYDGYVYAIPVEMVHRRNTAAFTMANQNGTRIAGNPDSGNIGSLLSGRPDGLYFDSIIRSDYIDMRHWIDSYNVEYERLMQRAFADTLSGRSRLQWQQLTYTAGEQEVWGNQLLTNDTIFSDLVYPTYATDPNLGSNTNYVRDKSVSLAQFSRPDGARRIFASYPVPQRIEFSIDPFGLTAAFPVAGVFTVTSNVTQRTVTVNPTLLSGGTGNKVGTRVPSWHWVDNGEAINPTVGGTPTSQTFTFDVGSRVTGKVICNLDVVFPAQSGTEKLPIAVVKQELFDGSSTHSSWSTPGNSAYYPHDMKKDSANRLWVTEFYANRVSAWTENVDGSLTKSAVYNLDSSTVANWATDGFAYPVAVATIGDPLAGGHIWISEYYNARLRRYTMVGGVWTLTQTIVNFTYNAQSRTFGNTVGKLGPHGISVSGDGNVLYASDLYGQCVWKFSTADVSTATVFAGVPDTSGVTSTVPVKLFNPTRLHIDAGGAIWVSDTGNNRILKFQSNGTLLLNFVNSDSTNGAGLDKRIQNSDSVVVIGVPGSGTEKYLVTGGTGADAQNQQRVFKLDAQFNVVAVSAIFPANQASTRLAECTVDSMTSPNYVYVGGSGNDKGMHVLRYSDLATLSKSWQSVFGDILAVKFMFACGTVNKNHIFARTSDGSGQYIRSFTTDGTNNTQPAYTATYANPAGVTSIIAAHFTQPRNVTGIGWCFYEALTDGSWATRLYRWTQSGTAWVRDATPKVDPLPGLPWGIDMDTDGNVYVSFPGLPVAGVSHVIYRYKRNGAGLDAPGAAGNTPGYWGSNGSPGSSTTTVAAPEGVSVSADGTAVIVLSNASKAWGQTDASRIVKLTTTTAKWEDVAQTPYTGVDTINQVSTVNVGLPSGSPTGVYTSGDNLYIVSSVGHTLVKFTMDSTGDPKTYKYVGRFGVEAESGNDHAHLNSPMSLVVSPVNPDRIYIADFNSSRILSIHAKMAGVSTASGNVETLNALDSNERLRLWSMTNAYQGVGSTVFPEGGLEYIWAGQVISASEFLYITTLGRSPLISSNFMQPSYKGAIERLPLGGKATGWSAASFDSTPIEVDGFNGMGMGSAFLRLPIISYGTSGDMAFDANHEDGIVAFVRDDANLTGANQIRGYYTGNGSAATPSGVTFPVKDAAQKRLSVLPYLIKRQGKVYLLIVTQILSTALNMIGTPGAEAIEACDIFEVPGRLLLR